MAAQDTTRTGRSVGSRNPLRQRSTETKAAPKTTEFIAYVVVLVSILIAGLLVDVGDDGDGVGFGPKTVWLYATLLTIGYMISRGLAKSGSRDPYTEGDDDH